MKCCKTCHVTKPLTEFYPSGKKWHFLECKPCANERSQEHRRKSLATDPRLFNQRHAATMRRWRKNNLEKVRERDRQRSRTPEYRATQREWARRYAAANPGFRIRQTLCSRIWQALKSKGTGKASSTEALLGCSVQFLKSWLQSKFQPGMAWENYGEWHIDHIIPCKQFDLLDADKQRACFHYTNLQPMWGTENMSKGSKPPATHQPELALPLAA